MFYGDSARDAMAAVANQVEEARERAERAKALRASIDGVRCWAESPRGEVVATGLLDVLRRHRR